MDFESERMLESLVSLCCTGGLLPKLPPLLQQSAQSWAATCSADSRASQTCTAFAYSKLRHTNASPNDAGPIAALFGISRLCMLIRLAHCCWAEGQQVCVIPWPSGLYTLEQVCQARDPW